MNQENIKELEKTINRDYRIIAGITVHKNGIKLYLNRGAWNGRQLVSAEWIDESTTEHSRWDKLLYGYLWWIVDGNEHSYAAMGDGGNVIYVNPVKNLVVAITSLFIPAAKDRIELIKKYIEPVFED